MRCLLPNIEGRCYKICSIVSSSTLSPQARKLSDASRSRFDVSDQTLQFPVIMATMSLTSFLFVLNRELFNLFTFLRRFFSSQDSGLE